MWRDMTLSYLKSCHTNERGMSLDYIQFMILKRTLQAQDFSESYSCFQNMQGSFQNVQGSFQHRNGIQALHAQGKWCAPIHMSDMNHSYVTRLIICDVTHSHMSDMIHSYVTRLIICDITHSHVTCLLICGDVTMNMWHMYVEYV